MKLKTKRLLAAALALSLTANISLAAFAVTYDLSDGDVTITDTTDDESGVYSYQTDADGATTKDSHDTEITITTKDVDEETGKITGDVAQETNNTVTINGDFSEVEDLDITIQDVNIVVNENSTTDAAITIEDNSDVDITLSGDNDITLDADSTSGIKIGDNSTVTLTVNGDTEIKVDDDLLADLAATEDPDNMFDEKVTVADGTVRPNIDGVVIGGDVAADSGEGSKTGSNVTITTEEEGSSLTIDGATVGIQIYDQSELTIDGNGDGLADEDDTEEDIDKKALEVNILNTQGTNTNVSGHGILNYGKLTITDNAQLLIKDVVQNGNYQSGGNHEGIGSKGSGGVEISGGADVTIDNVEAGTNTTPVLELFRDTTEQSYKTMSSKLVWGEYIKVTCEDGSVRYYSAAEVVKDYSTYYSYYDDTGKPVVNRHTDSEYTFSYDSDAIDLTGATCFYDADYVKRNPDGSYPTVTDTKMANGISMSNSGGVYGYNHAEDKLTIKDSGTTVKITGTSDDGIYLEGGEDLEVSGGATLEIGTDGGSNIGRNGIYVNEYIVPKMDDDGNVVKDDDGNIVYTVEGSGNVTISGDGTAVYINNAKYAGINFANADNTYITKDDYGAEYNHVFIVENGALLEVTGDLYGIYARNTNVTIGDDDESETKVTVSGADKGIALIGTNETTFDVNNATLEILAFTSYGIVIGTEGAKYTNNNIVNIRNNAKVNIASESGGSIILWGGNNVMTIDNATLIANSGITLDGSSSSENADGKARISTIYINNGARVEVANLYDYAGYRQVVNNEDTTNIPDGMGKLYVTGGTLKLTTDTTDENEELYIDLNSLGYEDATTLYKGTPWLWPTSGIENGDENLTNFRLSITDLETILGDDAGSISKTDSLKTYGFAIEYDEDGEPTTLTFETYGADINGNYIVYNKDGATNMTETEWYVVDLTKYTEEELEDLWVWTPAVVLSYFSLVDDNTLSDAVSSDESNPDKVTVGDELTGSKYHDVVVRGQSIDFGNFQTDKDYATIKLNDNGEESTAYAIAKAAADEKGITLYIYDAMDEGVTGTVSKEDLEGKTIIVKDEDGKFYTVTVNEDGTTSDSEEIGTYYYALTDADGNFIRVKIDDNGYIILDDNGNFILDSEGGYVYTDEDGNLLNVSLNSEATNDVRVVVSGTGYAILNDDGTYSSTDASGNPVTTETAGAVQVATAVYYYAQTAEDGTVTYVDENGNVLNASNNTSIVLAVLDSDETYVLYENGKYYLVNANGEKTVVVNGEELDMASLWVPFTSTTRVRSNSYATDSTTYNFENIFGGIAAPADVEEPGVSKLNVVLAEENDEPEEPDETEEPDEPIIPIVPVVPTDPSTPAQPETPAETPTETPAETPADPETPAEESDTPASSTPKTGDESNVAIYLVMAALSGAALIGLGVTGKKKNEEV